VGTDRGGEAGLVGPPVLGTERVVAGRRGLAALGEHGVHLLGRGGESHRVHLPALAAGWLDSDICQQFFRRRIARECRPNGQQDRYHYQTDFHGETPCKRIQWRDINNPLDPTFTPAYAGTGRKDHHELQF
jgi:hypothetical protein